MANNVIERVETVLEDGTTVVIKPLPIRSLKKFMSIWTKFWEDHASKSKDGTPIPTDDEVFEMYVDLAGIALAKSLSGTVDMYDSARDFAGMKDEYREYLEDNITIPVMNIILEVCGGIKDDPKELDKMMEMFQALQEANKQE